MMDLCDLIEEFVRGLGFETLRIDQLPREPRVLLYIKDGPRKFVFIVFNDRLKAWALKIWFSASNPEFLQEFGAYLLTAQSHELRELSDFLDIDL